MKNEQLIFRPFFMVHSTFSVDAFMPNGTA